MWVGVATSRCGRGPCSRNCFAHLQLYRCGRVPSHHRTVATGFIQLAANTSLRGWIRTKARHKAARLARLCLSCTLATATQPAMSRRARARAQYAHANKKSCDEESSSSSSSSSTTQHENAHAQHVHELAGFTPKHIMKGVHLRPLPLWNSL